MERTISFESCIITIDELVTASKILNISMSNEQECNDAINSGLSSTALTFLQKELSLNASEISQLLKISTRTLSRRKACKKLNVDESIRVFLLVILAVTANKVLVERQTALRWLKSPQRAFNWEIPVNHTETTKQIGEVINLLHQIEYGVYT